MDYKEKYEQALKRARELQKNSNGMILKKWLWGVFPELKEKESEDERIRKGLIKAVSGILKGNTLYGTDVTREKALAWLEKQGEKYTIIDIDKMVMEYSQTKDSDFGLPVNCMIRAYRKGINDALAIALNIEKQGEKKPTDNVEPKFKPGDWIIFNGLILHIDEVVNGYYRTTSRGDGIHNSYDWNIDNAARLWTIQDAKEGDILIKEETGEPFMYNGNRGTYLPEFVGAYCGIEDEKFKPNGSTYYWGRPSCPAAKEQRDFLFQKMKEAGYEWDADKKELKKMEVVSKESEDEQMIERLKSCVYASDITPEGREEILAWLEKQGEKKSADEVMEIRRKAYSDGYIHGQYNIAISLGKESVEALEHFVRSIGESGYASPYDNRTKLVYRLLEQLKQIVK